jgi:hypothetical protein
MFFTSSEKQALGSDGDVMGYRTGTLRFTETEVHYKYANNEGVHVAILPYTLSPDGTIKVTENHSHLFKGRYDPERGGILWNGTWYKPASH